MWVYMEYYQHEVSGLYYVNRYRDNMDLSTTPYGFKSYGLTPHRINDR